MQNTPKIAKETKNKIRVEFDRTPLKERLKAKFLNLYFFQKVAWMIFRLVLLVGTLSLICRSILPLTTSSPSKVKYP